MRIPIGSAVEILWEDSHGEDTGWVTTSDIHKRPIKVRTVGILHHRSIHGFTITLSETDPGVLPEDLVGGYIFIPYRDKRRIRRLR